MSTANNFPDINLSPIRESEVSEISFFLESFDLGDDPVNEVESTSQQTLLGERSFVSQRRSKLKPPRSQKQPDQAYSHCGRRPSQIPNTETFKAPQPRSSSHQSSSGSGTVVPETPSGSDTLSASVEIHLESGSNDSSIQVLGDVIPTTRRVIENSYNQSSEDMFKHLHAQVETALFTDDSSMDIGAEKAEIGSDAILQGVRVFVDLCCHESASSLKKDLRRMGAVVSRDLTETVTHVIFARGGSKETLNSALSIPNRPFLLHQDWVQECFSNQKRVPEANFSLYDGRYLVDSIRRISSVQHNASSASMNFSRSSSNLSRLVIDENDNGGDASVSRPWDSTNPKVGLGRGSMYSIVEESPSEDLSPIYLSEKGKANAAPMTASQLLARIEELHIRLDRLQDNPDDSRHGPRCNSRFCRQGQGHAHPINSSVLRCNAETNTVNIPTFGQRQILRRRSFTAFSLAHRAPFSSAATQAKENRDEQDAVAGIYTIEQREKGFEILENVNGVNDMRKTTETNLHRIRKTLQNNSRYRSQKQNKSNKPPKLPKNFQIRPPVPPPSSSSSSDEEGGGGDKLTPRGRQRQPFVVTTSAVLNKMQCQPSSDEFVSSKESRRKVQAGNRKAIMCSGFSSRELREIKEHAVFLGLDLKTKIDRDIYCVVSATGERTLTVLKAAVLGIPVVSNEWLSASMAEEKVVKIDSFEYSRWKRLIKMRAERFDIFEKFGSICVLDNCSPPSKELKWLIKRSGGQIEDVPERACAIVVPENEEILHLSWRADKRYPPPLVTESYILECITENEILPPEDYMNFSVSFTSE